MNGSLTPMTLILRDTQNIGAEGAEENVSQVTWKAQSSFKLQLFLCSRGYAMDNLDEAQR